MMSANVSETKMRFFELGVEAGLKVIIVYELVAGIKTGVHCGHSQEGLTCVLMSAEIDSAGSPLSRAKSRSMSKREGSLNW